VSAAAAMAIKLSVFSGLSSEVRETIKSFLSAAAAAVVDQAKLDQAPTIASKAQGDAPQTFSSVNQTTGSLVSGASAAETEIEQDTGEGWKNGATAVASHAMCTG